MLKSLPLRCAALVLVCLSFAAVALAHDPPQVLRIIYRDDGRILLSTNRGLIFGEGEQGPWRFMCNDVIHVRSSEKPPLAFLGDGRLMVVTTAGLQVSNDEGCNWTTAGFDDGLIPAFAVHPANPDRIYLATFPIAEATAMDTGRSALRMSEDGGESWSVLRRMNDDDFVRTLLIAPSDDERIYGAGTVYASDGRMPYALRSSDGGETWETFPVEVAMEEADFTLLNVSPTDPDLVVGKVGAGTPRAMPERLVISRDGGETFETAASIMMLRDAVFSADGTALWLTGSEGLLRSNDDFTSFERTGSTQEMTTALDRNGELLAAGWYEGITAGAHKNGIARTSDGAGFETMMSFIDVLEPIACDEDDTTPVACAMLWRDWEYEVQNKFSPESLAGTPNAGTGGAGSVAGAGAAGAGDSDAGQQPGASGSGGASGKGSSAGSGGSAAPADDEGDAGGCSCRVASRSSSTRTGGALLTALFAFVLARLARRRSAA